MRDDTTRLVRVTEALTHNAIRELLAGELRERFVAGADDTWIWIRDVADEWVVYELESPDGFDLWQLGYTLDDEAMSVTLAAGDPVKVIATSEYAAVAEAEARYRGGRVLESKGVGVDGGRIFEVQVIEAGTSRNGYHYPLPVLECAVPLYNGAKAFDHHRTLAELQTSTVDGLVGSYRNARANESGIVAELHLLASATGVAEAFDMSLEQQSAGLPPLIGISHDVQMQAKPAEIAGRRVQEAVSIMSVLSADVVADPSAGGRAQRAVAGGTDPTHNNNTPTPKEGDTVERLQELMAKLRDGSITDEENTELDALLGQVQMPDPDNTTNTPAAGDNQPGDGDNAAGDKEPALAGATEAVFVRESLMGRQLVGAAIAERNLPTDLAKMVTEQLGDRFTEADLVRVVEMAGTIAAGLEKGGLVPKVGANVQVGDEELDKLKAKLDRTLEGGFQAEPTFWSYRQMLAEFGVVEGRDLIDGDLPSIFLREAYAGLGKMGETGRVREAIAVSSFAEILGDSVARRMIAAYNLGHLQSWRLLVSDVGSLSDFRTQRRTRLGGYGNLPTVAEAGSYTALTSPTDEEVTYAPAKRGGTETLSLESIANDDLGALRRIPTELGTAAAQTIYDFVFDFLSGNAAIYDTVALFHASHNNLGAAALSATTLQAARAAMREQTKYGAATQRLNLAPRYLVVPAELEQEAYELCNSAVAVTSNKDATVPNINQTMDFIVCANFTDANNWYAVADPAMVPTITVDFYQGRQDPELFMQDMGTVGSVFDSDQIKYKIRHIYGGAVQDYRGLYGAVVA